MSGKPQYSLIMMGAPGAGKGTQAQELTKEYGLVQISTGEMLRTAVSAGTAMGKAAAEYMASGKLVPDEVIIGIVRERLSESDCEKGFILDGFPRTVYQAEELKKIMESQGKSLTLAINIEVPIDELIERAVGRRICKKCGATYNLKYKRPRELGICDECGGELYQRADDTEETMRRRLQVYEESTRPLIEYYKAAGKYVEMDGCRPIAEVTESMKRVLRELKE